MGRELQCRASFGARWVAGKALLETNEIIFRGDPRVKIPLASVESVVARNGELHVKWLGQSAVFELGEQAPKWAHVVLHPKSTIEKLGIKPGLKISALRLSGDGTMEDARKVAASFSENKPLKDSDVIFFGATTASDLGEVKKVLPSLAPRGAVWVVYPKGRKEITELQVLQTGRDAGLFDVKVVSYSATHTALKFVRPREKG